MSRIPVQAIRQQIEAALSSAERGLDAAEATVGVMSRAVAGEAADLRELGTLMHDLTSRTAELARRSDSAAVTIEEASEDYRSDTRPISSKSEPGGARGRRGAAGAEGG